MTACGDATGPLPDYDPTETVSRLDDLTGPFDTNAQPLLGLDLAAQALIQYGVEPAGPLLAVRPTGAPQPLDRDLLLRSRNGNIQAIDFPSTIRGRTLTYDVSSGGYVVNSARTGAPTNGVRIVYYETDPQSGYPITPLRELGYIDLTDEDRSAAERVGVRIVDTWSGAGAVLDYYVELEGGGNASQGSLRVSANGWMRPDFGSVLDFDLSQHYSWDQSRDRDVLQLDYDYQGDRSRLRLTAEARSRFGAASWETLDLSAVVTGGARTVEILYDVASTGALTGEIRVEGRRVIEVDGVDGSPSFRRVDGSALTGSDLNALDRVVDAIQTMILLTEWLLIPAALLAMPG